MGAASSSSCATSQPAYTLQQECLSGPASAVHGGHPQLQTNTAKAKTKSVSPQVGAVLRFLVLNRLHRRLHLCSSEMCYSCRTGRFVGVWSSLSMSRGYKLSLMKDKETRGTRQDLQTRPTPAHTSTRQIGKF